MVHVLDELTVRPGRLGEIRARFATEYVPRARERGMTLVDVWMTPPVELHDEPMQLLVLWAVPDESAWWGMRRAAGEDASVAEFWGSLDTDLLTRSRRMLVPCSLDDVWEIR